jgi:hypothetical protein
MNKKLLLISYLIIHSSLFAISAESVYNNTAKFFSFDNLSFNVYNTTKTKNSETSRSFFVAKGSKGGTSSLLMRFKEPQDIKCTAVLITKTNDNVTNYLYFPSLNRTKIIPSGKSGNEIFGLGISYSELNPQNGVFEPLEEFSEDGKQYYKVTRIENSLRSQYIIKKSTSTIEKIIVYKNDKLEKEMVVEKVLKIGETSLIIKWYIKDYKKDRIISYTIDEDSISSKVNFSLFRKNRLERCVF